jgi:long-subunit acyl-CoA synthetase (AMP-forming)
MYYGASELSYVTYIHVEKLILKPLSVGKPFKGVEVFVQDDEIYVNSDFLAANTTKPATVHDRGKIDLDGDLLFWGRKKISNKCDTD